MGKILRNLLQAQKGNLDIVLERNATRLSIFIVHQEQYTDKNIGAITFAISINNQHKISDFI